MLPEHPLCRANPSSVGFIDPGVLILGEVDSWYQDLLHAQGKERPGASTELGRMCVP